ncbi:MAG: TlpA family protein disulfide reductase [Acidobacteria bacterium]|nr:TlpA family protein disulfide reductase [Acidobacteriota bacterium]
MANKKLASQKSKLPIFAIAIVVILVALVAVAYMSSKKETTKSLPVSSEPIMVENVQQSLEAYRGKVVILDIWATWCGPCRIEIPDFIKLQNQYRAQGLEIIGVSVDPITQTGAAAVAPFVKSNGINYTIWMVNSQAALSQYPMGSGIPTTYILDRNGRVAQKYVGVQPMSRFESDIKALL